MPNVLADIATVVTSVLNGAPAGTFALSFTAVRSYADWELPLEGNQGSNLMVDVVPVGKMEAEIEAVGSLKYSPDVDICVRLGLGPDKRVVGGRYDVTLIDPYVELLQSIAEYFAIDRFGGLTSFAWDSSRNNRTTIVYSHLRTHHQFTGIVRIPFTCSVSI